MGVIVGQRTSHFALRNLFIGPDPAHADTRLTSLGADAGTALEEYSLLSVLLPATPSTGLMPFSIWKERTESSVVFPYFPSIAPS